MELIQGPFLAYGEEQTVCEECFLDIFSLSDLPAKFLSVSGSGSECRFCNLTSSFNKIPLESLDFLQAVNERR